MPQNEDDVGQSAKAMADKQHAQRAKERAASYEKAEKARVGLVWLRNHAGRVVGQVEPICTASAEAIAAWCDEKQDGGPMARKATAKELKGLLDKQATPSSGVMTTKG